MTGFGKWCKLSTEERIKQSIPRSGMRDVHHVPVDPATDSAMSCYCDRLDSLAGRHGDDFSTEGEGGALYEPDEIILASFKTRVLPRLGQGASTEGIILRRILRWSEEGVHMAPDGKHVENPASLLEVKGAKRSPTPSSRATGRRQRRDNRFDLQFATKELAQDMQTPIKWSMLRLRLFVRYLLGAADLGPFFAYQQGVGLD